MSALSSAFHRSRPHLGANLGAKQHQNTGNECGALAHEHVTVLTFHSVQSSSTASPHGANAFIGQHFLQKVSLIKAAMSFRRTGALFRVTMNRSDAFFSLSSCSHWALLRIRRLRLIAEQNSSYIVFRRHYFFFFFSSLLHGKRIDENWIYL